MILTSTVHEELPSTTYMTFFGPDNFSRVLAFGASGQEIARFMIQGTTDSAFAISRIFNDSNKMPVPICKSEKSSLSGTASLFIHGQTIKVKGPAENLASYWKVETPHMGTWKWHPATKGVWKLKDNGKIVMAMGNTKEAKLEVLVPGDETTLDILLATWVMIMKKQGSGESSEGVQAAFQVLGMVLGMNG